MAERLAEKSVCVGTERLIRPPTPPDTPTQARTPGTNRWNAKYKRTIPLDHPRTGPNNSSYVMDGSTRHFWPLSMTEQFLSTNAPKEERPCTRVGATAGTGRADSDSHWGGHLGIGNKARGGGRSWSCSCPPHWVGTFGRSSESPPTEQCCRCGGAVCAAGAGGRTI